jgi:KDO2-lipid IV(A) lauroyltransferase
MNSILSEGASLGFIADQDAGRKGLFVDFFGRKASTYKSIGLLAITQNIPVCVGYARRKGDFLFEIGTTRLITPEQWEDKKDPLLWLTQEYTSAIEKFIREEPSQYWWLHRRWKHQPKEKK